MVVLLNMPATAPITDLEHLRERPGDSLSREKEKLREATREFESFFIYEMLKNMRRTIPENSMSEGAPMSSGSGKETFTSLFDMEIARKTELGGHNSIADLLYNAMDIPQDIFTPLFAMARITGWTAHVMEQRADNALNRPLCEYTGKATRKVVPLAKRQPRPAVKKAKTKAAPGM